MFKKIQLSIYCFWIFTFNFSYYLILDFNSRALQINLLKPRPNECVKISEE